MGLMCANRNHLLARRRAVIGTFDFHKSTLFRIEIPDDKIWNPTSPRRVVFAKQLANMHQGCAAHTLSTSALLDQGVSPIESVMTHFNNLTKICLASDVPPHADTPRLFLALAPSVHFVMPF